MSHGFHVSLMNSSSQKSTLCKETRGRQSEDRGVVLGCDTGEKVRVNVHWTVTSRRHQLLDLHIVWVIFQQTPNCSSAHSGNPTAHWLHHSLRGRATSWELMFSTKGVNQRLGLHFLMNSSLHRSRRSPLLYPSRGHSELNSWLSTYWLAQTH